MLRSTATVSLSGTLPDKLEAAAAARFDGVEIFESDLLYFGGSPREIRRLASDLGLEITLYQPFRDFEGLPPERRARNLDRAERKFDVMEELGVRLLLLCSNVSSEVIRDDAAAAEDLAALADRAGRRGIRVGYEALAWGTHVRTWGHAWKIVQDVNHPSLGLLVDSFHTLALNDDPSGLAAVPGDRLFFVQVADAPRLPMDVLPWSRHFRCYPGQGEFDLAGFLAPIVRSGYGGPISLEVFNDDLRAAPARQSAADGMRSLLYLEEATRLRLASETASAPPQGPTSPARPIDLFTPPPPSPCHGFEFIEFAADEGGAARLGAWLEQLGFVAAGRHRSKKVTLYRHDEVNLLINAEGESFAHAYYLLHGPSVCAMAFRVEAANQALNRARLYRCQPFEGRIGPNELLIPAVRAPDGSLIYLVDANPSSTSIYDTDFVLDEAAKPAGGSLRVDHVSLALPDGQFDSWVLFFKAAFGFRADATFVLPDPYGLVRSKAVQSPEGSVRLPLNISQSRNTATARSISAYSGVGVQHIALATDDIFRTVADLQERGLRFLAIPANYYEDLAAKFGLDDAFVDRLAASSILYDREGGGEFFHVYTESFEERFSFEIVERRGYGGYGAANAPVRLAAQAQAASRLPDSAGLM
ncbi:bifunctional sugar phosphate isomerase/epimerase/4-hydroxyphenylpyruvate dioxygenase family protein [Arenibaculum pallidiluteum]|uniref:bifunctional sugar phosphate isomerase/epimerase/4-hydroxyphenylpyruvate dioxygenase family protein n=1 Tax=Arenibaculum pallidiluteum TaxID=2812559 RepID=UPI001A978FDE|nr:TIM barrel protein [Arenibaculum pallidiluteum]